MQLYVFLKSNPETGKVLEFAELRNQLARRDEKEVGYFWWCWHLHLPRVGSDGQRKVFLNFDPSHRILTNCESSTAHLPFNISKFYLEDYTKDIKEYEALLHEPLKFNYFNSRESDVGLRVGETEAFGVFCNSVCRILNIVFV